MTTVLSISTSISILETRESTLAMVAIYGSPNLDPDKGQFSHSSVAAAHL
jgi:hypothetical protein